MPGYLRLALGLAACSAYVAAVGGQEPPAKLKAKVEFRWVEVKRVEGLTEDKGFRATCDPKGIAYPHKKAALVLTPAEVSEARLTKHDFSDSGGPAELYSVTLHLTKEARAKLAATCDTLDQRGLTVVVDGKYWGVHRYEKDKSKPLIPDECRAETFLPSVGFFSSKADAERLVDAFR
ncbi:MAG TPA: hypothetical protein VM597_35095 [Gemmataceae bacterium]|jgi:hypothetical protein|nr:hypothetical protein [Gemmataceae bacterium]